MTGQQKISVVVPTLNCEATIERCVRSVLQPPGSDELVELIVVDGCSQDRTLDLVGSIQPRVSKLISEPDRGLYQAMNKGLRASTGDWVLFLGADDYLTTDAHRVFQRLPSLAAHACVFGDVLYDNGHRFRSHFDWTLLLWNRFHHQAAIYSRSLFAMERFQYDETRRIASDYELNLLSYLKGLSFVRVPETIAVCGGKGVSARDRHASRIEIAHFRRQHVKNAWLFAGVARVLYFLLDVTRVPRHAWRRFRQGPVLKDAQ